jgi:hypothetical protein
MKFTDLLLIKGSNNTQERDWNRAFLSIILILFSRGIRNNGQSI